MRAESLVWEKTFFARLRLALEAFSAILRCIRLQSMSFGVRRFAAFHLRFSTRRLSIALLSTLYFTGHKIHKSGASVSAIEHTRLKIGPTADCPARTSLRLLAASDA